MNPAELRRLLELAAKAVGGIASDGLGGCYDMEREKAWAPHLDDGDSRRLEVALFLTVAVRRHEIEVFDEYGDCLRSIPVDPSDDLAAATRLAVLRAAAAIGEAMQQKVGAA